MKTWNYLFELIVKGSVNNISVTLNCLPEGKNKKQKKKNKKKKKTRTVFSEKADVPTCNILSYLPALKKRWRSPKSNHLKSMFHWCNSDEICLSSFTWIHALVPVIYWQKVFYIYLVVIWKNGSRSPKYNQQSRWLQLYYIQYSLSLFYC